MASILRSSPSNGLLAPAVEEVRHVRVLLRLGAPELRETGARDDLGEDVRVGLLRERDRKAERAVVRRHARVATSERRAGTVARNASNVGEGESARQLARAVGAEVEVQGGVARADAVVAADHERLDELVGLAGGVAALDALPVRCRPRGALGGDDGAVGSLDALPAVVAVHAPVAAAHGADAPAPPASFRSTSATYRGAVPGCTSRPSRKAWTTTGTPAALATSISAARCTSDECTPPSLTRPSRWSRPPALFALAITSAIGPGSCASVPSWTALSMREMSIMAMRPAPKFRCPTSLLPICPGAGRRRGRSCR